VFIAAVIAAAEEGGAIKVISDSLNKHGRKCVSDDMEGSNLNNRPMLKKKCYECSF
jgi:hypothetical protein